jgi:hypothetical protein
VIIDACSYARCRGAVLTPAEDVHLKNVLTAALGRRWFSMLTALQHITDIAVSESKKFGDDKVDLDAAFAPSLVSLS